MMEISRFIILGILFNFNLCNGLKILAVFPLPNKSHGILGDSIVKHLIDSGHEVTYISPFVKKELHPKLEVIDVPENRNMFSEDSMNIKMIMDKMINFQNTDFVTSLMINLSSQTIQNQKVQKLIQDPDMTFDVVIGQWMFSDLYCVFAEIFDCPMIWLSTIEPHYIILNMVDGPTNPAYTNAYQNGHVHPLSFIHRIYELWTQIDGLLSKSLKFYYKEEEAYQRFIVPILKQKNKRIPSYEEIRLNASLVLGNTQVVMGDAIALPQNYKHIGGYHIDEQLQPLPENLKNLLDNARHGVIYFSMGSNIKSKDLPVELKQGILKVFGSLNQTVIWKFEETLSVIPKNVHIVQWAPQQSILAHPNLVLFITHGGLLSLTEAVHFGVPVIVIPAFADQFANALRAEKKGYGKKIELTYTMYKDLKIGIDEVLHNPIYSKKAKEISAAYHDRPMTSKQELLFWVNHVVRTRGAPHLRSPALQLSLYQRLYLDLFALIIVSTFVLMTIIKRMFKAKIFFKKEKRS